MRDVGKGQLGLIRELCVAAAVKGMKPPPPKNGSTYSEEDWNDTSALDGEAYWLSKVSLLMRVGLIRLSGAQLDRSIGWQAEGWLGLGH